MPDSSDIIAQVKQAEQEADAALKRAEQERTEGVARAEEEGRKSVAEARDRLRKELAERFRYSQTFAQIDPWKARAEGAEAHEFHKIEISAA